MGSDRLIKSLYQEMLGYLLEADQILFRYVTEFLRSGIHMLEAGKIGQSDPGYFSSHLSLSLSLSLSDRTLFLVPGSN